MTISNIDKHPKEILGSQIEIDLNTQITSQCGSLLYDRADLEASIDDMFYSPDGLVVHLHVSYLSRNI